MTQHPRTNGQRPRTAMVPIGDQPLANIEAEADVLASLLQSPVAVERVVDELSPEDFYRDAHRTIYQAVVSLYQRERRINRINVADELRQHGQLEEVGGETVLRHLESSIGPLQRGGIEEAASAVQDIAKFRRLREASLEIFTAASNCESDAVDRAIELISRVALGTHADAIEPFEYVVDSTIALLRQRRIDAANGIARGLSSGFPTLDALYGGFQPSHLIVLGALTGYGKSAFAWNATLNVALAPRQDGVQKHVYFASLEMTREELVERALAAQAMVDHSLIRDGLLSDAEMRAVEAAAQRIRGCRIWLDEDSLTIQDIARQARRRHARGELDLVVVDYLQLLENTEKSNKNGTRAQDLEGMSRQLKQLAHELDVPVVALVQLNRNAVEGQEPSLAHINESGGIARNSNVVVFFYAEEDQLELRNRSDPFTMTAKVAKARSGRMHRCKLTYLPRVTKFINEPLDEQVTEEESEIDWNEESEQA
jgi:replicative DNA helicase